MDGYKLFAERFRKDLHIKINSIYLIDNAKRFSLIDAVNKIENIEDLMEIDTKIDVILQKVGEISIKLLDGADPTILTEFYANLKKLISQTFEKRNVKELLELKEIEINI